ncbi:MAG: hypothetical protein AAF488_03580, partial [Planctomycetota bacterium]
TRRKIGERNPRFATKDKPLLKQAIAEWKKFERLHAKAAAEFRRGERDVVFPYGTYGYKVVLGVRVSPKPIPRR